MTREPWAKLGIRVEAAAAVLLTLLAIALHALHAVHAGALWRDEAGALQLATLPTLGEVFERFPHEAFPMLFPALLRSYVGVFGDSDLALRLFGMTIGIAILGALWCNARAAGTVPLAAVSLLGLHPAFLVYGDSIRGYGLGVLLILLTLWAFSRLVIRPDRRAVVAAAVLAVLSVHALLHNSAMLLGLGVAAAAVGLARRRWRLALAALGVGFIAAVTLIPYIRPLSAARDWDVLLREEFAPEQILDALRTALGHPALLAGWIFLLGIGLAAAVWALARKADPAPEKADARLLRLLVIPATLAAQIGLFLVIGYLPQTWYFLPLLALVASALDGLLASPVHTAVPRAARLTAAALVAVLLLPPAIRQAKLRMTNVDLVAHHLEQNAAARDLVLVNPWFCGISFQRYYQGRALWLTIPSLADHRMHRYDLLKVRMASADPLRDVLGAVRHTLRSGGRVWVAGMFTVPRAGQSPPVLGPAPAGSPWGWRDSPYSVSWSLQLGVYLQQRANHEEQVIVPVEGSINAFENLRLYAFHGLRPGDDEIGLTRER